MSTSSYSLEFDVCDNPMQLSKVGNWVITFLSPASQIDHIQLAMTFVVPRQANDILQARKIIIQQSHLANQWQIEQIECYDSMLQKDLILEKNDLNIPMILNELVIEFEKYDVSVKILDKTQ